MAIRAIAASGEQVVNDETYLSSDLGSNVQVYLPAINAGANGTVAVDTAIRVETTGAGSIELLTKDGRRVGIVPGRSQALVVAQSGAAQSEADRWAFTPLIQTPAAYIAPIAEPEGVEVTVNSILAVLVSWGLIQAEAEE